MARREYRLRFLLPLLILIAALFGSFFGAGLGLVRFQSLASDEELFGALSTDSDDRFPTLIPPDDPQPRVLVDEPDFDFGTVESGALLRHPFTFKNVGQGPLEIRQGTTTCKCTISNLAAQQIPPGGEAKVTLEWEVKGNLEAYRQVASIYTNDRAHKIVRLSVSGRRHETVVAVPNALSVSMAPEEEANLLTHIYSSQPETKITTVELLVADTAQFFTTELEEVSAETAPIPGIKTAFALRIAMKPGLPLGQFQQTIRVATDVPGVAPIDIPIQGVIKSDISVVGDRDWDPGRQMLKLGAVPRGEGGERKLLLVVIGPHRDSVEFSIESVEPKSLEATLGEAESYNNGKVRRIPLTIRVPPGSEAISRMGTQQSPYGEVRVKTSHPAQPEVKVRVQFAVE